MEALAVDKLIEKGGATRQFAQAIGEALDITLKAANFVTVPMLDARFAQFEAKMEVRFGAMEARFSSLERGLERGLESAKLWAVLLYAGLAIVFFGAMAVEHRWVVNREDQLMEQVQGRSDARFAAEDARTDKLFAEDHARTDKLIAEDQARTDKLIAEDQARTDRLIAEQRAHADQVEARLETKLDQLRALIINGHGIRKAVP